MSAEHLRFPPPAPDATNLPADTSAAGAGKRPPDPTARLAPLLIDTGDLAALLTRSVPSLQRAAGRLPTALRIGGSKRWRFDEFVGALRAAACRSLPRGVWP